MGPRNLVTYFVRNNNTLADTIVSTRVLDLGNQPLYTEKQRKPENVGILESRKIDFDLIHTVLFTFR